LCDTSSGASLGLLLDVQKFNARSPYADADLSSAFFFHPGGWIVMGAWGSLVGTASCLLLSLAWTRKSTRYAMAPGLLIAAAAALCIVYVAAALFQLAREMNRENEAVRWLFIIFSLFFLPFFPSFIFVLADILSLVDRLTSG
jgi:chromate transport protein ChrA